MKKFTALAALLLVVLILTSCSQKKENVTPSDEQSSEYAVLNEDTSLLLESDNIPNTQKISIIENLSAEQYAKAEKYKAQIEEFFEKSVSESAFFADKKYFLDDAKQSVDEYCKYLRNEYDANINFFESCATVKYEGGTAGSFYLAWNKYECAKAYADKLDKVYSDLCGIE